MRIPKHPFFEYVEIVDIPINRTFKICDDRNLLIEQTDKNLLIKYVDRTIKVEDAK